MNSVPYRQFCHCWADTYTEMSLLFTLEAKVSSHKHGASSCWEESSPRLSISSLERRIVSLGLHVYWDWNYSKFTRNTGTEPLWHIHRDKHEATSFTWRNFNIWGSFENFVDWNYYSESELCRGAVTVSFSKYLPWQAMYFLQRSTHFLKTCCRPLMTSKFLASELPFHGWKSPEIAWGEIWTVWQMF
jgi:hypothetical protein